MRFPLLLGSSSAMAAIVLLYFSDSALAGKQDIPRAATDADFVDDGTPDPAKFLLGQMLFFDKIISGNRNISCATCHHAMADTGDGLSLPVGEGGLGLGVTRDTGSGPDAIHERVPRNAPPVFNLGTKDFTTAFHDGRIQADPNEPSGFRNPAGANLPTGLDSVLAAQAMFPVTSSAEMAGQAGEGPVGNAAAVSNLAGPGGVWDLLAQRLQGIPEYVDLFKAAFPSEVTNAGDITFVHAANAIAAFEAFAWRADKSPFDQYLRRDRRALSFNERKGMVLFYGSGARCYQCHSGKFQSDFDFHAIAMPQVGTGKGNGFLGREDFGRELVTGNPDDRYRFRTPPLRNVALTGPWGHDGAYNSLEEVVRHHFDPVKGLNTWDRSQFIVPPRADLDAIDFVVQNNPAARAAIASKNELSPNDRLNERHLGYLVDFLHSLTDPRSIDLRLDVPVSVPSGLPLYD